MKKNVKVVQDQVDQVPVEVLATSIKSISQGTKKLLAGPLNHSALVLLIQHAAPTVRGRKVSVVDVKAVLEGMESLEKAFLKSKTKERE